MNLRVALAVGAVVTLTHVGSVHAQAQVDSLEALLSQARGADRLPLLVDLTGALSGTDPDRALEYGREARGLFNPQTDPNLVRRLWGGTGDAHMAAGHPDSTLAHAERLRRWAKAVGDARGLADAAYSEGVAYRAQRAFDEALASLEDARDRYEALGLRTRVADAANAIGRTYAAMQEHDKALATYERALKLYEALGDDMGRSNVHSNIGIVHAMRGDLDQAAPAFTRALEIREKIGDEAQIAPALANLGALRFEEGDIRESLALQQRALAIRERLGNTSDLAYSLHNVGIAQNELGHHAEALRALTRSAALFEEIGDEASAASALSNTGVTHAERGDYEQALDFQRRALALNEKVGDPLGIGLTLNRIGDAYRALGDYAGALGAQEHALEVLEEAGLDAHVPTVLMAIGTIYSERRQYAEALDVLERALTLDEAMGDKQSMAAGALAIGQVYLAQGDLAEALAYTDEALGNAEEAGVLILVRNAYEQRAQILELQERFPEALAAYRSFKAANDSLFTSESQSVAAQLQEEYRTKEQRQRIELLERERAVQRLWVGGLVGGLVLLSLLVGLAYNRYRLKQRANLILTRARDDLQATQEQLQAAMQKTEAQAAQLVVLDEAKSRFFANISHELRTPLTLTLGPLEDLRSGTFGRLSTEGTEQVDTALRNSRRLLRLVGQLLDVARLESGRFDLQLQTGDLGAYVRTLAQPFVAAPSGGGCTSPSKSHPGPCPSGSIPITSTKSSPTCSQTR